VQRGRQIRDVHKSHTAHHTVERSVCHARESAGVSLDVLDTARLILFVSASYLEQLRRKIDGHNLGSPIGKMSGYPSLATREVAKAPTGYVAEERLDGWPERIVSH